MSHPSLRDAARSPADSLLRQLPARPNVHRRNSWLSRLGAIAGILSILGTGALCRPAFGEYATAVQTQPPALADRPAFPVRSVPLTTTAVSAAAAPVTPIPTAAGAESTLTTNSISEAPSVVWLIVMPAIPLVGGTLIYLSRRLFGKQGGECRLITTTAIPENLVKNTIQPGKKE